MPRYLHLEERRAGEQSFTAQPTFVLNTTADCTGIAHCEELTVEEVTQRMGVEGNGLRCAPFCRVFQMGK